MRLAWRILFAAIPFAVYCEFSRGAEVHTVAHGFSKHTASLDCRQGPRESNHGAALRLAWSSTWAAQAGNYANSCGTRSYYALADYTPKRVLGADVGVFVGLVDGYPNISNGHVTPGAGAVARWSLGRYGAAVRAIPNKAGQLVFSIEFSARVL